MKIAILVPLFPPRWLAGTEVATYNIAKHLAQRQHEVHVITWLDEGLPKESIEDRFHIHRISGQKVKFLGVMSFWVKIFWLLKKINPDIVHVQSIGMGMPAFLAKKLLRKPYVVWGRGSEVYLPWQHKKPISKLVLRNADAAIALTEDMKREMQKICDREVSVIPNGLDLERFENLSRDEMRGKLQAKAGEKLVIFVGRFRPDKGVRYLIEAMEIIRQKGQPVKLILGGEGPEEENLKQLVEQLNLGSCINFIGQIPNEKVPQYMVAAHVFALSSLSEGFPNVVLEAMASGLPIVASKVGGLTEIVRDAENGFLVEPKNPEQMAEKVSLLLNNDDLRQRISRNNKEKVKEYSWGSAVSKLERLYQSLL